MNGPYQKVCQGELGSPTSSRTDASSAKLKGETSGQLTSGRTPTEVRPSVYDQDKKVAVGFQLAVSWPPVSSSSIEDRPYQLEAVDAIDRAWWEHRWVLLHLATGLGKTIIAARSIQRQFAVGRRILFLVHRSELATQSLAKLAMVGVPAALELAESRATLADRVVVASVQSMQGARLERFPEDHFDLVVIDEAHHAVAPIYKRVLDRFPHAKRLLLSATPYRADGRPLDKVCEVTAYRMDLRTGIAHGYLAPIVAQRVWVNGLDLSAIRTTAGDFNAGELDEAMRGVVAPSCEALVKLIGRYKTIVFAVSVAHAKAVALELFRRGISATWVDGSASAEHRAETLERFRTGAIQVLVNCALLTEGFDEPSIECVAIMRPTRSVALYTQMAGRGTRLWPGKLYCLLLDFVGVTKHSLAGPADALMAGDPALNHLRDEVERVLLDGPQSMSPLLDRLIPKAQVKIDQARLGVIADFRFANVDPFIGEWLGEVIDGPTLSYKTRTLLSSEIGVTKPPPGLSEREAQRWLAAARARTALGLCSVKAARRLSSFHLDTSKITKERARHLFARLAQFGWAPSCITGEPEYHKERS